MTEDPPTPAVRPAPAPPLERLAREPGRFSLDQAAHLTAPGGDVLALRYRTTARLGYPLGEVLAPRRADGTLTSPSFGLIGPGGVLPRHFTALVGAESRKRSLALHAFLDLAASRFTGLHVKAAAKYQPARDPLPAQKALAAAVGLGTPHLADRTGVPLEGLLYHAGNLAARSRSADRLAALLAEETGVPVTIQEFTGGWLRLPETERTRLGGGGQRGREGQHARLGAGALAGAETWDAQARFTIRLGPLDGARFAALLPGTPEHRRVVALTRLVVGLDTGFVVNPVLAPAAVPALALGQGRLGWTSWLGVAQPRPGRGGEAKFDGSAVTSW